ncbi:hypothetical protein ACHQM5_008309 [Ranunculus cassubicifolius]
METYFSIQCLLLLPLFLVCLYLLCSSHKSSSNNLVRTYPILGHVPDFLKNRHRLFDWTTDILLNTPTNTFTFIRPGKLHGIITANPSNIEFMLKTNFENHPKGERFIFLMEDFLGRGIFNSDGEQWKTQRKVASHEFSTRSLRSFVIETVRSELQTRFIPLLSKACTENRVIDLQDFLERFAFDNICQVAFNEDPACLGGDGTSGREFMVAFEEATRTIAGRFYSAVPNVWLLMKFLNIGSEKRLKKYIGVVHKFAERIIDARIQENGKIQEKADLLSRFISANDENLPNSKEFLRDIVISFILAGRDTTSAGLSWFFWLLSSRPKIEKKILEELKAIRNSNGKRMGDTYDLDELRRMHYLHAAITEAMRLYPPVPVDSMVSLEDVIMPDGTFAGKGWFVSYHTYAMGRIENIWGKNCNEFLPERWLENGIFQPENPFRYPVFHAGPRMCLGREMAYIQMKSVAACVIENFEIHLVDKITRPRTVISMTLRMKDGLMVRMKDRPRSVVGC